MTDIAFLPATELAARIRRKAVGARELLDHFVQRIDTHNPKINAVVTLDLERARARADAADAALARSESWGPLHGLPITIKDSIETAGIRTTSGAVPLAQHVPVADAPSVQRLVAAGAVVFGKTNLPTFAMDTQSYNPLFGTTNNPWDLARTSGGSSGGAAAALAAGLTALELGSDIGGSIRSPAHFCGVYGHKPSFGIVPARGHIPGPPGTLSHADIAVLGPMARGADDLALALDILAGADTDLATAWRLQLPAPRHATLRGFRVAAWLGDEAGPIAPEVEACLRAAVDALRREGVQVDETARPRVPFAKALDLYWKLLFAATSAGTPPEEFAGLARSADALAAADTSAQARYLRGSTQRHRDWLPANEMRLRLRAEWARFFGDFDVLLCPVAPTAAFLHDHSEPMPARTLDVGGTKQPYLDQLAWAGVIGMAHLPSTSAPVGRTPGGLPVGMQIVGPHLEDRTPIAFAAHLAKVVGGFVAPPGY
jgi:amidase